LIVRLFVYFAFLSLNERPHTRRSGGEENRRGARGCKGKFHQNLTAKEFRRRPKQKRPVEYQLAAKN
jgi:hypothetical protein